MYPGYFRWGTYNNREPLNPFYLTCFYYVDITVYAKAYKKQLQMLQVKDISLHETWNADTAFF